jgi:hypothetical protein
MQTTTIMAVAVAIAAGAIGLAAPAHAETGYQFISPNGTSRAR